MKKPLLVAAGLVVLGAGVYFLFVRDDAEVEPGEKVASDQGSKTGRASSATDPAPAPAPDSPQIAAAPRQPGPTQPDLSSKVEGDVRDDRGNAVGAAQVALVFVVNGRPGGPPRFVAADASGRFQFAGVPAGTLRLV